MAGFLLQWPTILGALMPTVLVFMYLRLALREAESTLPQSACRATRPAA